MGRFRSSLCPTRDLPDQVGLKIFKSAANRLDNQVRSDGSLPKVGRDSVRVGFDRNSLNLTENKGDLAEIW